MNRERRLRKRRDFEWTRVHGKRYSNRLLTVGVARNDALVTRFGFAVGRRVGKAVARNKVKRRLREAARSLDVQEGWNVTVAARPQCADARYGELKASLETLCRRAGILRSPSSDPRRPGRVDTQTPAHDPGPI